MPEYATDVAASVASKRKANPTSTNYYSPYREPKNKSNQNFTNMQPATNQLLVLENGIGFPNFTQVTANVDKLGYHGADSNHTKFPKVIKMIQDLLQQADIVCLQEVGLLTAELKDINHFFEGCTISGSMFDAVTVADEMDDEANTNSGSDGGDNDATENNNIHTKKTRQLKRKAGVAIITKQTVLDYYNIESTYSSTTRHGKGRIVSNKYTPKPRYNASHCSFRTTCCYLQSGQKNNADKRKQIQEISDLPTNTVFDFVGGDMNFTDVDQLDKTTKATWTDLVTHRNIEEVFQPENTFFRMNNDKIEMSRLDRWYSNITAAQSAISQPVAHALSSNPFTVGRYCDHGKTHKIDYIPSRTAGNAKHVTDHIPVSLKLIQPTENGNHNKSSTLPGWTLEHFSFEQIFEDNWTEEIDDSEDDDCFAELVEFDRKLLETAAEVDKRFGSKRTKTRQDSWVTALATYRCVMAGGTAHEAIVVANGNDTVISLIDQLADNKFDRGKGLQSFLDRHIDSNNEHFSDGSPNISRVERLSKAFPKMKNKISTLRDENNGCTSDPQTMTKITKKYWGAHFRKKFLRTRNIKRFLRRHYPGKYITEQPRTLDLETMKLIILESGDTAPGPNNIPFAAYRKMVDLAAPIFLKVITALQNGTLPPLSFNDAIFHLLPKKGTGWVADTRPLSVSNTYNRIIASAIKWAIQPSLLGLLHRNQVGFWPGRTIDENIDFFNEIFYKALDNKEEYTVMLFDIAKAFDSVSHDTIHAVLEHIGLPENYRNAIKGLFHNARVHTNFKGGKPAIIEILSGIKQGCPLSPLLFIVIMDILNSLLMKHADVDIKIYADDTAAGDQEMATKIEGIKKSFHLFETGTNMKLNTAKTVMLTTLPTSKRKHLTKSLYSNGWGKVEIKEWDNYLGIPLGRQPPTEISIAYNERQKKFQERLNRFLPHKRQLSMAKRITLINVFALPLISYPQKFFIMPKNTRSKIQGDIDGLLENGKSFCTSEYSRPQKFLGPRGSTVLIDTYVLNLAVLASKAKTIDIPEEQIMTRKIVKHKRSKRLTLFTWSMRISTQRAIAVRTIMRDYGLQIDTIFGKAQGEIYKSIVNTVEYNVESIAYTARKLAKWGTPSTAQATVHQNHVAIPKWVPDYAIFNFIHMTHNALQTTARIAEIAANASARNSKFLPHITSKQACYLCKNGEDSAQHIFQSCKIVTTALIYLYQILGLGDFDEIASAGSIRRYTTLECTTDALTVGIQYVFNSQVWYTRGDIKNGNTYTDTAIIIWQSTIDRIARHSPTTLSDDALPNNHLNEQQKKKFANRVKSFGAAGKRTTAQAIAAAAHILTIQEHLPEDTIEVWTDGSSLGNPGPSGAGVLIKSTGKQPHHKHSYALGTSTNQVSEIWAVGGAFETLLDDAPAGIQIRVFTDSMFAIKCITGKWHSKKHFTIVEQVRKRMKALVCMGKQVRFHHVAGHADIAENEEVDVLAKAGAETSSFSPTNINISAIAKDYNFNYLLGTNDTT
jgi:ribonuclease HI